MVRVKKRAEENYLLRGDCMPLRSQEEGKKEKVGIKKFAGSKTEEEGKIKN
jgi:hypothetical protein